MNPEVQVAVEALVRKYRAQVYFAGARPTNCPEQKPPAVVPWLAAAYPLVAGCGGIQLSRV